MTKPSPGSDRDDRSAAALARQVAQIATAQQISLAVAESLTGGLLSSALAQAPAASRWFHGGVVAYASHVKHDLLGVPAGPVVTADAAAAMAQQARTLLGADLAVSVTGAGGPDPQDGQPPGTVFFGLAHGSTATTTRHCFDAADPEQVCHDTVIHALQILLAGLTAPEQTPVR